MLKVIGLGFVFLSDAVVPSSFHETSRQNMAYFGPKFLGVGIDMATYIYIYIHTHRCHTSPSDIYSPQKIIACMFVLMSIGTDDLSHSCSHRYFTPNFTFASAFVTQNVFNSEVIVFHFA